MPTTPVAGAVAGRHPDDVIIRAEQLAFVREQFAALGEAGRAIDEEMHALHAQCRADGLGSPEHRSLVRALCAVCEKRIHVHEASRYWIDVLYAATQR